jgi:hypothetical protein
MGEWRYINSPYHFLPRVLDGDGQFYAPVALTQGKEPQVPTGYETNLAPESV